MLVEDRPKNKKDTGLFGDDYFGDGGAQERRAKLEKLDAKGFKRMEKRVIAANLLVFLGLGVIFSLIFFFPAVNDFFFKGWAEKYNLLGFIFGLPIIYLFFYNADYFFAKARHEKKAGIYDKKRNRQEAVRKVVNKIFILLTLADLTFFAYQVWALIKGIESRFVSAEMFVGSMMGLLPLLAIVIFSSFKIKK